MSTTGTKSGTKLDAAVPRKDEVVQRLDKLEARTKAINSNNVARVANSHLTSADDKLHVLHSLKTGRPIERFPTTPKEIAKLTDTLVDAILLALDVERTGSKEQKVEKLRMQIGLKPSPA
ncbi:hypothetical protein AOQ84DRAFT_372017 [Glonium stellatum]|uniref:Uncharacterized protein n=1 Tax=Glonium stellatum TaxID=574774 RepID=A0A8E2FAJ5_9PEZI|nr:hypothetical protein AOQ84DRAFT_372017 [Glonium stellatum]